MPFSSTVTVRQLPPSVTAPYEAYEIKKITDPAHPCYKERGLFARRTIALSPDEWTIGYVDRSGKSVVRLGTHLCDYAGIVFAMTQEQLDAGMLQSEYAFELHVRTENLP